MSTNDTPNGAIAASAGTPTNPQRRELLRTTGAVTAGVVASGLLPGGAAKALASPSATEIVALDAYELSGLIKTKEVSCVEVMDAFLKQIDRVNPKINAIVALADGDKLRAEARERDSQLARGQYMGWMHGFPQAIKDTSAAVGFPFTAGSPIQKDYFPKEDAVIAERARRDGAIMIGKTNTPEFALGSNTVNPLYGNTVNPFDLTKTVGGSSGGAGAALVARMLPVADGSDMGGSIRNPSAYCNVYGLRPTAGVVPFAPSPEVFIQQLAIEGPMGRTVKDVAMLLSPQAGHDPRAPLSVHLDPSQFTASLDRDFKGAKIGWLGNWDGYFPMEPGVMELCESRLKVFTDLGCEVEPVKPWFEAETLWQTWLTQRAFLVGNNLRGYYENPELRPLMKRDAQWEVEQAMKMTPQALFESAIARTAWVMSLNEIFKKYDFILSPTAQVFPFDVTTLWPKTVGGVTMETYHQWMGIVLPWSLAGTPVMNVPVGFSAGGVPMGMQVIGPRHSDFKVMQMARAYEKATGFAQKHVPAIARAG